MVITVMFLAQVTTNPDTRPGFVLSQVAQFAEDVASSDATFGPVGELFLLAPVAVTAVRAAAPEIVTATLTAFDGSTHDGSPKVTGMSQSEVEFGHDDLLLGLM